MKNFTKSRQEFADLRSATQVAAGFGSASWVRPWRDRTLVPMHRPKAGAVGAAPLTRRSHRRPSVHEWGRQAQDGVNLGTAAPHQNPEGLAERRRRTWTHSSRSRIDRRVCMLLSFQRPSHLLEEGRSPRSAPRPARPVSGRTDEYSARIRSRDSIRLKSGRHRAGAQRLIKIRTSTSTVRSRGRSSKSRARSAARSRAPAARRSRGSTPTADHRRAQMGVGVGVVVAPVVLVVAVGRDQPLQQRRAGRRRRRARTPSSSPPRSSRRRTR